MSLKHRLLGPAYSEIQGVLASKGSLDPRQATMLVRAALSKHRPSVLRNLVALAYVEKAYVYYRGRRSLSISTHYDLPRAFYELFLDADYSAYSCAIFDDEFWTLDRAQRRKFEILNHKLAAKPGHRIVDIGCGWGSFLKYAREVGLEAEGIALSNEQVAECRRLGFRAEYADAADGVSAPVDRFITIGMMEHSKDQRSRILRNCFESLVPGGRMVVQEICSGSELGHPAAAVFVIEEFFRGDQLGTYASVQREARRAGFQVMHLESFGLHYRATTLEWARRLADRFEEAEAHVGYRTAMTHLLCYAGFSWYFEIGALDLIQYVLVKPG